MFASEYYKEAGCAPDIMTFAKSVAGGLPLSGIAASKEIMDKVTPGTIGGTYSGNAVACASALKLLEIMQRDDYPGRALKIADVCMKRFNEWKEKFAIIGDVRGTGAMMGIEFISDDKKTPNAAVVGKIVAGAWEKGLILESAGTYGNVIRFLCPLCVTDEQLAAGLDIFEAVIKENV
jgi:4-aminobutyrate aminotransferase/(S)-3-amino-2-methylpropionate transaminase